jgi:hypothetical protein
MRKKIENLNKYINEIISRLSKVKDYMKIYYNIYKDIYDYFDGSVYKFNYETLQNLNDFNFHLKYNNINDILHIYNLITNQDKIEKSFSDGK